MIYTIKHDTHKLNVASPDGFPPCACGRSFIITDHRRKRRHAESIAFTAQCPAEDCHYHIHSFIGFDAKDLAARIKSTLHQERD
jgi:hypothetical protein